MNETGYNGWTNYETWAANLWIDNDQGTQGFWAERAREALRDAKPAAECITQEEAAGFWLADQLKADAEEMAPDLDGMYADLLNAALWDVNWHEIAEHMIESAAESQTPT